MRSSTSRLALARSTTMILVCVLMLSASTGIAENDDGPMLAGQLSLDLGFENQKTGIPGEHSDSAFAYGGGGKFTIPIGSGWSIGRSGTRA